MILPIFGPGGNPRIDYPRTRKPPEATTPTGGKPSWLAAACQAERDDRDRREQAERQARRRELRRERRRLVRLLGPAVTQMVLAILDGERGHR